MITPGSTNPKLTDAGRWNVFRVCGRDDQQGALAGKDLIKLFPGKKIAIVDDRQVGLCQLCHSGPFRDPVFQGTLAPDLRNDGTIAGLPDDAVVEVPAMVDRSGAHPVAVEPLAPEFLGLVQAVTAYEVLTIEAARTGNRAVALRALLANPLVRQWDVAVPLLDELILANRDHLPRFA